MLIKVTNYCTAACSHCMEDSTPKGLHMTREIFDKALAFSERIERRASDMGVPSSILLSGGECTEHPEIVSFVETLIERRTAVITLITNGLWLDDPKLRSALLRKQWTNLLVQVTYDPRFYAKPPPKINDSRVYYVDALQLFIPLGRGKRSKGLPPRKAPTSFNLRSLTRGLKSVEEAIAQLRLRTLSGRSGHCVPSIGSDGTIRAGETNSCWPIGTVDSTNDEVTQALLNMGSCNHCGLEDRLSPREKRAIGVSTSD